MNASGTWEGSRSLVIFLSQVILGRFLHPIEYCFIYLSRTYIIIPNSYDFLYPELFTVFGICHKAFLIIYIKLSNGKSTKTKIGYGFIIYF